MMNEGSTSSTSMSNSEVSVDKLSYKELQGLAMALNLPGKMKQGVLVEAIKARQSHNEQAVTMILEANRQRKILRRQQQQQIQQQQLMRLNAVAERVINPVPSNCGSSRRKSPFPRPRMKRPASEMEADSYLSDETLKRSKLAVALTQHRRPVFFNPAPACPMGFGSRREQAIGHCGTWEQSMHHQTIQQMQVAPAQGHAASSTESSAMIMPISMVSQQQLPIAHRPLPDLSKDLSILPTLNDCSTTATPPSSDEVGCCSVNSVGSASSWSSLPGNSDQTLPNATFDSCDSGWLGSTDESYDMNAWKNMTNNPKAVQSNTNIPSPNNFSQSGNINNSTTINNSNSSASTAYDNISTPANHGSNMSHQSSSGYFDDQSNNNSMFNNSNNNSDVYRSDDFMTSTPVAGSGSNFADFVPPPPCSQQLPVETPSYQGTNSKSHPNWNNPTSNQQSNQHVQQQPHRYDQTVPSQQQQHFSHHNIPTPLPIAVIASRLWFDCYDANCYHKDGPMFRIQRPGNPSALFVPSGRSFTLPTFCNTLPRLSSYVQ